MTTENKAAYGDLVRFRSELPEHVLEAALTAVFIKIDLRARSHSE